MTKRKIPGPELWLVAAYVVASVAYYNFFDKYFYITDILKCYISFAVPIPYIILVAAFILLYSRITGEKASSIACSAIAVAAILPLSYLLVDFMTLYRQSNPFGENLRGVYGIYAKFYFVVLLSILAAAVGYAQRRAITNGRAAFYAPATVYILYAVLLLFASGFPQYAATTFVIFLAALSQGGTSKILSAAKAIFSRMTRNEVLVVVLLFTVAFVLRYFWGMRLLDIVDVTGKNFTMASDDGPAYDQFAANIASGIPIPLKGAYSMSGFGYWYFLGGLYRIFGLHNFAAVVIVQSLIGATVPILTYILGRMVFKSRLTAVVAGAVSSLDMTLIFLSVILGMEALYIPLVMLALVAAVYFLKDGTLSYAGAFLMGASLGLAYNARPPELIFYPIVLAAVAYMSSRAKTPGRRLAVAIALLFIGFALVASAQYVTNYFIYGPHKPGSPGFMWRIYHKVKFTNENKLLGDMGFSPFEDFGRSMSVLLNQPKAVLWLLGKGFVNRLILLYFFPNFGMTDPFILINPGSGWFFRFPVNVLSMGYAMVAFGFYSAFSKNRAAVAVPLSFFLYRSFMIALTYVHNSRYRGLLLPIFFLFLAYGINVFYNRLRNSSI